MKNYKFSKNDVTFFVNGEDYFFLKLIIFSALGFLILCLVCIILFLLIKILNVFLAILLLFFIAASIITAYYMIITGFFSKYKVIINLKNIKVLNNKTGSIIFEEKFDKNNLFTADSEFILPYYKIKTKALVYGNEKFDFVLETKPELNKILLTYDDESKLIKIKEKILLLINLLIQRAE